MCLDDTLSIPQASYGQFHSAGDYACFTATIWWPGDRYTTKPWRCAVISYSQAAYVNIQLQANTLTCNQHIALGSVTVYVFDNEPVFLWIIRRVKYCRRVRPAYLPGIGKPQPCVALSFLKSHTADVAIPNFAAGELLAIAAPRDLGIVLSSPGYRTACTVLKATTPALHQNTVGNNCVSRH